jgi:predicted RNA binding protein YcfA (HicA-like mRNA interferase family)
VSERRRAFKAKDINKALAKLGAEVARQKGSHAVYQFKVEGKVVAQSVVPQHNGDVPVGTVAAIVKDFVPAFGKGWLK